MRVSGYRWPCRLGVMAGLLVACLFVAPAAEAKYGLKVSPWVGGPRAVFKVSFVAPAAVDGRETDYYLDAIGPPPCPAIFEFSGRAARGKRVVMRLTPRDDLSPFANVPGVVRWCRGSYVGVVYLKYTREDEPNLLLGRIRFRVGPPASEVAS
jgi:hypothetical protein